MTGTIDVDVVRANAAAIQNLGTLRSFLDDLELERANAFKVHEPATTFVVARGLLRSELGRRLGVAPRTIVFSVRPSGKPDVVRTADAPHPDWRFSVSHTASHVAIAFALGADLGIDIERTDRLSNPLEIATRYFTETERGNLERWPEADLPRAFFAGWTRKEAIVKARGSTMAESLTSVAVEVDPDARNPTYEDERDREVCALTSFEWPDERLIGAVAVRGGQTPILHVRMAGSLGID